MANNTKIEIKKNNIILSISKGIFWAISISLLCVLIFALVIKYISISDKFIQPINQIIKIISILFACFIVGKKIKTNGWLCGLIIGLFYTLFAFILFSVLDGKFVFTLNLLNDLLFGGIIGLISGILGISLRKNN